MPGACDSQCFAVQATLLWVGVAQHPLRDHTRIFQILLERVHRHPQPFPRTTAPPAGLPLAPTSIDLSAIPSCIRFTSAGSYPFFRQIVRTRSNVEFCLIRGRTCCEWQHSQGIWYNNNTTLIRVQVGEGEVGEKGKDEGRAYATTCAYFARLPFWGGELAVRTRLLIRPGGSL